MLNPTKRLYGYIDKLHLILSNVYPTHTYSIELCHKKCFACYFGIICSYSSSMYAFFNFEKWYLTSNSSASLAVFVCTHFQSRVYTRAAVICTFLFINDSKFFILQPFHRIGWVKWYDFTVILLQIMFGGVFRDGHNHRLCGSLREGQRLLKNYGISKITFKITFKIVLKWIHLPDFK